MASAAKDDDEGITGIDVTPLVDVTSAEPNTDAQFSSGAAAEAGPNAGGKER